MATQPPSEITRILSALQGADRKTALAQLLPIVYDELRALAGAYLQHERADHTLQPTALVHEAYLRLLGGQNPPWSNRAHFYRSAAEAMRRILVDHARKRGRLKRGGDRIRVNLSSLGLAADQNLEEILALDESLRRLEEQDPRATDVVRLRFFAGLSVGETAQVLEVSERTVKREWTFARAWLYSDLREDTD